MKRYRLWFVGAFVLVTALLGGVTFKVRQNPLYQLSRYPKTPAFERYIFRISSEMDIPLAGVNEAMLQIDDPVSGDFKEVAGVEVHQSGRFSLNLLYPDPAQFAAGRARFSDLNPRQLARVKALMRQLPPSAPPAKRENLLVVLLYQPAPTPLRLYDRRNVPPQIREIVLMTTKIVNSENRNSNSQNAVN